MNASQPKEFCDYMSSSSGVTRFCPVPKVKGIYQPTQEQTYENCVKFRGNVNKKLPGILASPGAISSQMRRSILLRTDRANSGTTQFVLNTPEYRQMQSLPNSTILPLQNRF